ncbi:AbrB/MazE/SpoVT family DNA-binding domain-containing protein [Candidatus Daviesbacteria bacterium]|nr:AbrB/MazE/SpoVT family DNA-binding domain-containing protein [Candidatus Daviesbacteria bacterium]
MQLVTVGSRYQIVIPKEVREKMNGLRPGLKVAVRFEKENILTIKTKPVNWLEQNQGIARKAWKNINTTKYLEDLRNEWDQKV